MIRSLFGAALAICVISLAARAQSVTNLSIVINGPASTAISCPINYPAGKTAFTAPLAAGTLVAVCSASPSGWSGALTLSGTDASFFALSGMNLNVGSTAITAPRNYAVTLTATP